MIVPCGCNYSDCTIPHLHNCYLQPSLLASNKSTGKLQEVANGEHVMSHKQPCSICLMMVTGSSATGLVSLCSHMT